MLLVNDVRQIPHLVYPSSLDSDFSWELVPFDEEESPNDVLFMLMYKPKPLKPSADFLFQMSYNNYVPFPQYFERAPVTIEALSLSRAAHLYESMFPAVIPTAQNFASWLISTMNIRVTMRRMDVGIEQDEIVYPFVEKLLDPNCADQGLDAMGNALAYHFDKIYSNSKIH